MSIIDIEKSKQLSNAKGIVKTIDENALTLILDNVQIAQYVYPEASTVRELTSNAIDGQKEKERAIEILTGKAKVEDYYIVREDPEGKYKDSKFNAEYYDLKHLDTEHNKVELSYIVGTEGVGWCDRFIVKDYGVGLGDGRLYGYMQIGYSSKRNTTGLLGGYGLGGKAGLSLRNDYFTTETVHNGRRFKFNCFSYKVDSLIGRFNTEKGIENPHIVFPDGSIIYYESTTDLNYTQITIPCKTHHKDKFKHAVESQLLYFDNIDFTVIEKSGFEDRRSVQAKVIYNSESLIIADQYQYSKPHIVVVKDKNSSVGVSYGYVNFKEMEMQDMFGSVGFKCPLRQVVRDKDGKEVVLQEGIDCTPSRESIVWSDATRLYVSKIIEKATEESNRIIESQLKEDDFLVWLDKATNILGKTGDNRVLKQLSHIIDKTQLSPVYQADKTVKYCSVKELFWGLNPRFITKTRDYKSGKDEITRTDIEDWYRFSPELCFLQTGQTNLAKDHYIIQTRGNFTTVRLLDDESLYSYVKEDEVESTINPDGSTTTTKKPNKWTKDYVDKLVQKRDRIVELIKKSALYKSYDDVVVPEDWNKKFEASESEEVVKENEKEERLTPAELRKLAEQTIVHSLVKSVDPQKDKGLPFKWIKNTIKISDLKDDSGNVYYSYGDEDTIPLATVLLWRMFKSDMRLDPNKIKLYKVSKSMPKKFLKNHRHINQFFKVETDKSKTMAKELVEWTTAKYIRENLDQLKFMRNYRLFNQEIADLYKEVKDYAIQHYDDTYKTFTDKYPSGKAFIDGVLDYTSKITEFQLFVRDHSKNNAKSDQGKAIVDKGNKDAIQRKALELFGIDTVEESVGYNLEMYDKMQILLNYAEPVKALLNHVNLLVDIKNPDIPVETEALIKEVIEAKGLQTFTLVKLSPVIEANDQIEVKEDLKQEV